MVEHTKLIDTIRSIPDFPKKGIVFRDITPLLNDEKAFREAIDILHEHYRVKNITKIVSVEARGFIIGAPLAYALGAGFVPVRKPKKLPAATLRQEYQLEYGTDAIEIHKDALSNNDRVVLVDDLLATGGTILAAAKLVERLGSTIVGMGFLIELAFLKPRERLRDYNVFSIIAYDSE